MLLNIKNNLARGVNTWQGYSLTDTRIKQQGNITMGKKTEQVIFSNYCDDSFSFNDAKEYCIERHLEDFPEETDWKPTDSEVWEEIYEQTEICWEDTQYELKKFFNDGSTYILTGSAGLWNGRSRGGIIVKNYNTLTRAWANVDSVKIFDEGGVFHIYGYHHDGTNCWEVKKLTKRGVEYLNRHEYDDPQTLHEKLWGKGYSVNLHYAKKVFGC